MKTNKFLLIAGVLCASLFSACSSDDSFEAGPQATGQQAFFPQGTETNYELSMDATSFDIPLMRVGTEAVNVPLKVTTNSTIFKVPTSVSFAQGKKESKLSIGYNPKDLVVGQYDTITVTIPDDFDTPYGLSTLTLLAGVSEPWNSLGTGKFADWFVMEDAPYEVEFMQSALYPNKFRIMKPYTQAYTKEGWPDGGEGPCDYIEFRILKPGEVVKDVTITLENLVYYGDIRTGYYNESYSDDIYVLHPSRFSSCATEDTWTHNYVVDYQENGLPAHVQFAPFYYMFNNGGWNKSADDGYIEISFPGVADYSCAVEYTGRRVDVDENVFITANCTMSSDVASAKLALIQGKTSSAIKAAVAGIADGSIEAVEVAKDGDYEVPMAEDAESDSYTLVLVTFDAAGEAQDYDVASFTYTAAGAAKEEWTPQFVGTFQYKLFFGTEEEPYDDEGLVLCQSSLNENRYKIEHVFYDVDFIFEINEDGTISFDDQYTGYTISGVGEVYVADMYAAYPDDFEPSFYDNGVFSFSIGYYAGDEWLTYGSETYTLTGEAEVKAEKRMMSQFQKALAVRNVRPTHMVPFTMTHDTLK